MRIDENARRVVHLRYVRGIDMSSDSYDISLAYGGSTIESEDSGYQTAVAICDF